MGDLVLFRKSLDDPVTLSDDLLYGQEPGSTVYHDSAEDLFVLARDDHRFAGGVTWICLHCGGEATISEDWVRERDLFLLRKLSCGQCGRWWLMPGAFRFVTQETMAMDADDLYEYWILLMSSWAHSAMNWEV